MLSILKIGEIKMQFKLCMKTKLHNGYLIKRENKSIKNRVRIMISILIQNIANIYISNKKNVLHYTEFNV